MSHLRIWRAPFRCSHATSAVCELTSPHFFLKSSSNQSLTAPWKSWECLKPQEFQSAVSEGLEELPKKKCALFAYTQLQRRQSFQLYLYLSSYERSTLVIFSPSSLASSIFLIQCVQHRHPYGFCSPYKGVHQQAPGKSSSFESRKAQDTLAFTTPSQQSLLWWGRECQSVLSLPAKTPQRHWGALHELLAPTHPKLICTCQAMSWHKARLVECCLLTWWCGPWNFPVNSTANPQHREPQQSGSPSEALDGIHHCHHKQTNTQTQRQV